MATRVIPAKTEVICDSCQSVAGQGSAVRRMEAVLTLKRHALDYLGNPAADGSVQLDLCDRCTTLITSAINDAVDRIRASA